MAQSPGVLRVTIERARELRDCDWFTRQDPYAIVRCGAESQRTKTHTNAGSKPIWHETFEFKLPAAQDSIKVEIWDEDRMNPDDLIGTAQISLDEVRRDGSDHVRAPVVHKRSGKAFGHVAVLLEFESENAPPSPPSPVLAQLHPGVVTAALQFKDWYQLDRRHPYAIVVRCGDQTQRMAKPLQGSPDAVWNGSFEFEVASERSLEVEVWDDDGSSSEAEIIGYASISLKQARLQGAHNVRAPVINPKSSKQQGFLTARLEFRPSDAAAAGERPSLARTECIPVMAARAALMATV